MGRDARHYGGPGLVAHWLPVVLVLALLGSGLAAYRFEWGQRYLPWLAADPQTEPASVAPPPGLGLPDPATPVAVGIPVEPGAGALDPAAVAAALEPALADRDLGRHVVAAVTSLTGAGAGWDSGEGPYLPASTTKLLTGVAALAALGPDARFETRVVAGAGAREIVLVGGGDPYLAGKALTPEEAATAYPERADLDALAASTAAALGPGRYRLHYDDSLFTGPVDNPRWRRDYVPDDIVSPITALMADGGREPDGWRRYDDPSLGTAQRFAEALGRAGLRVVGAPRAAVAPEGAAEVAAVQSAPVSAIVEHVLDVSDNEGAEVLARHVGLAVSGDGSFTGGSAAIATTLGGLGLDTSGLLLHDGSGLSRANRFPPELVLGVLRAAADPARPELRAVLTGLPVAGFTGSLAYRFDEGAAPGLGAVRAKTGTLTGVHALAGVVQGRDGTPMAFVLAADRVREDKGLDAQDALDRAAAALAACRCGG